MEHPISHNGAPATRNKRDPETPGRQDSPKQEALEARSVEVEQIIGRPPHWLVRGGIGVFLGVILLIFVAASTIEYPEIVQAKLTLHLNEPPQLIEASREGMLSELAVESGSVVEQGELLGVVETDAFDSPAYRLEAPTGGILTYANVLVEGQQVGDGQPLFQIRREDATWYGEISIPESSFGKVRQGQRLLARLSGYPTNEYGSVEGQVDYFSQVLTTEGTFQAKVSFPDGLTTNFGQQLSPVDGMTGQADIITNDMKLLERIYYNLTRQF